MNKTPDIIQAIVEYATEHPELRFCQILADLNINYRHEVWDLVGQEAVFLVDNYFDSDDMVLERIKESLEIESQLDELDY